MKKVIIFFIFLIAVLSLFNSCKHNNQKEATVVAKNDSLSIPNLDAINDEIRKDSMNPYLYYKRAQIYDANQDYRNATKDMFFALSLDSLRPEYFLFAADLFKKTGEPKRGIALMDKAIATDSLNTNYYVKAAELAYIDTTIRGNYRLALSYLNTAIDKNPENADIYFYKGNVYKEMGDTSKAISSFQTATELNPKFYNAFVQLGLLLEKRKDKSAEKYYDNAIKASDKPEDALYDKANLLKGEALAYQDAQQDAKAIEKFNEAIDNFKKVIDVNHRNVEAYMGAAFSYYQLDSMEDAYKFYGLAAQIDPSYAGAYFSKGVCAEEMGRANEAMALYKNCLNIDPTFKKAEEHLKKLKAKP